MRRRMILCGQCAALVRDAGYHVVETTRREKAQCGHCQKRKYSAECTVEKRK